MQEAPSSFCYLNPAEVRELRGLAVAAVERYKRYAEESLREANAFDEHNQILITASRAIPSHTEIEDVTLRADALKTTYLTIAEHMREASHAYNRLTEQSYEYMIDEMRLEKDMLAFIRKVDARYRHAAGDNWAGSARINDEHMERLDFMHNTLTEHLGQCDPDETLTLLENHRLQMPVLANDIYRLGVDYAEAVYRSALNEGTLGGDNDELQTLQAERERLQARLKQSREHDSDVNRSMRNIAVGQAVEFQRIIDTLDHCYGTQRVV